MRASRGKRREKRLFSIFRSGRGSGREEILCVDGHEKKERKWWSPSSVPREEKVLPLGRGRRGPILLQY